MEKIVALIKKVCTKEVIFYGIFGVLTTIVNLLTFYVLTKFFSINENISNIIAIVLAVLFAYFTNRKLVFNSKAVTFKQNFMEFCKFILGRAFTMVVEFAGCALFFAILDIPDIIIKAAITVIVIILNFFISKFFAFKK